MFDEIEFDKIKRLPKYVFAAINEIKLEMRQRQSILFKSIVKLHQRVKIKDIL